MPFSNHPLRGLAFDLVLAVFAWVGVIGIWAITLMPFGRRLVAIREDELLARAIGIDVVRDKMLSFFIGSFYAGIGGSLYAGYVGFISPRNFDLLTSLNIWLMVAFGGRGTIMGPIIGAAVLAPVPFLLQQYASLKDVIYGALVIVVMVLMPMGLYGGLLRHIRLSPGAVWLRTILLWQSLMVTDILVVRELSRRFGGVQALQRVDVAQRVGETLGMIGPKRIRQASFVNAVTGDLSIDSGTIRFAGRDITGIVHTASCRTDSRAPIRPCACPSSLGARQFGNCGANAVQGTIRLRSRRAPRTFGVAPARPAPRC